MNGGFTMKDLENYISELEKNAVPDGKIDLSDAPELTEEDFSRGHFKYWKPVKKTITIRIDMDNLSWLKDNGAHYQTKLNEVLRWARLNNCPIAQL